MKQQFMKAFPRAVLALGLCHVLPAVATQVEILEDSPLSGVITRPRGSGSQIVRITMELMKELKIDFNKAHAQACEIYERRYLQQQGEDKASGGLTFGTLSAGQQN